MVLEPNAEAEIAQATEAPPQPTAEQLQEKIAQLTADVESAKREAKSHQEYGRKQKEELDRQRGLDGKVSGLETRLEVVTEMLAAVIDKDGEEPDEPPKKRRSEEYLARLKNQPKEDSAKQREMEEFTDAVKEADGLVKSIGLEMDKSPETRMAYLLFRSGDYRAGLEEVKKLVESKNPKETEADRKANFEKDVKAASLNLFKEWGLLVSDTGLPSGKGESPIQSMERYVKGQITAEEAVKRGVKF